MIFYGIFFAFIGYVYSNVLLNEFLWPFKERLLYDDKIPEWIRKPLGGCSICFTGQLTLWGSIPLVEWTYVGIVQWFGVVCLNIVLVAIINVVTGEE
jgi:quinol-cytochrome oxidoreductase complex cytochrome b subunit